MLQVVLLVAHPCPLACRLYRSTSLGAQDSKRARKSIHGITMKQKQQQSISHFFQTPGTGDAKRKRDSSTTPADARPRTQVPL